MATKPRFFDPFFYYHIYNCGVEKRTIFENERDFQRFLDVIDFYLYDQKISFAQFQELKGEAKQTYKHINPLTDDKLRVSLIAYCLMPNHFHFVLKQKKENGITSFISDISNSHSRYFNIKYDRLGKLYQGPFKAKQLGDEQSILNVTRYVHINPPESKRTNPNGALKPENYPYSSYQIWINPTFEDVLPPELSYSEISRFRRNVGGASGYKSFTEAQLEKGQDPKLGIEPLIIE